MNNPSSTRRTPAARALAPAWPCAPVPDPHRPCQAPKSALARRRSIQPLRGNKPPRADKLNERSATALLVGHTTTHTYDSSTPAKLKTVTDPEGRLLSIDYGPTGPGLKNQPFFAPKAAIGSQYFLNAAPTQLFDITAIISGALRAYGRSGSASFP